VYPTVVEMTPAVLSNGRSMLQKQPPANVAVSTSATGAAGRIGARVDARAVTDPPATAATTPSATASGTNRDVSIL
jgi:hypothetical protein